MIFLGCKAPAFGGLSVVGLVKEVKAVEDIAFLFRKVARVTVTRLGLTKASDMPRLQKAFTRAKIPFESEEDTEKAFKKACLQAQKEHAPLLVTGSFYLIAAVKPFVTL